MSNMFYMHAAAYNFTRYYTPEEKRHLSKILCESTDTHNSVAALACRMYRAERRKKHTHAHNISTQ